MKSNSSSLFSEPQQECKSYPFHITNHLLDLTKQEKKSYTKDELKQAFKTQKIKIKNLKVENSHLKALLQEYKTHETSSNLCILLAAKKQIESVFKTLMIEQMEKNDNNTVQLSLEIARSLKDEESKIEITQNVSYSDLNQTFNEQIKQEELPQFKNPIRFVYGEDIVYELTDNKMIRIGPYKEKGLYMIHIREYYNDSSNKHQPARKGTTITVETWNLLMDNIKQINADIQEQSAIFNKKKK